MKILTTMTLAGAMLALPTTTNAWVAYGHAGYGCCYHAGYSCGGVSTGTAVAAGIAGLAVGAAIANANKPTTVVVAPPVYPTTYYVAPPPVVVVPSAPVGSIYYSVPYGAQSANINGIQYYVLGSTYYRPFFGSNGVYYQVVPNPI
jgi:hypothetical protein